MRPPHFRCVKNFTVNGNLAKEFCNDRTQLSPVCTTHERPNRKSPRRYPFTDLEALFYCLHVMGNGPRSTFIFSSSYSYICRFPPHTVVSGVHTTRTRSLQYVAKAKGACSNMSSSCAVTVVRRSRGAWRNRRNKARCGVCAPKCDGARSEARRQLAQAFQERLARIATARQVFLP